MSDYEDDMEVDPPQSKDSVLFSSDNTNSKGKRSAANLPVEAEDNLPWYAVVAVHFACQESTNAARVEKYRPDTLDDVSGHQDILTTINKFVETNVRTPHLSAEIVLLTTSVSGYRICSSMVLLAQAKHLQF